MTVTTYAHAAALARDAFAEAFPHIGYTVRPVQSERVVEIAWTDGPTASQVKAAIHLDGVEVRGYRRISADFAALLADDFQHITGKPYDPIHFYAFTFEDGRLVPSYHPTRGAHLLRYLSQVTSVDGDRCVWSVKS